MMRVALFVHHFLKPTHHAIALVLHELQEHEFFVFGKSFSDRQYFQLNNVVARIPFEKDCVDEFADRQFQLAHIIYDGDIAFAAAELAAATGVPFVLSFHGGFDTKAKIHNPLYTSRTKKIAEQAAIVTVTSKSDLMRLRSLGITRDLRVVPVPVDFKTLPPPPEQRDQQKLITIGRLIEKKGIDITLRALSLLPAKYSLTIIGEGRLEDSLRELSSCLGLQSRVEWLGLCTLQHTLSRLNVCGILLHAAKTAADGNAEGTPQTILWAQALGVPVIATYSGDVPDIVQQGETGLLVQSGNPNALAQAIRRVTANHELRRRMTFSGRQYVRDVHALPGIESVWREIYRVTAEDSLSLARAI